MASIAAIEKPESNKSSSFLAPAELLLAQADEPYQQHPQQEQLNDVATPSLIDLSTGLMGLDSGLANTDEQQSGPSGSPGSESGPLFDPTTERNVTVLVGRTANLHCRVRYLGNRTVSAFLYFQTISNRFV